MKRWFKKTLNKKRPSRRRLLFYGLGVISLIMIIVGLVYFQNYRALSANEYSTTLSRVTEYISEQQYDKARSLLMKLEASGGKDDYRVYAAYADIENYQKNSDKAKEYAEKSLELLLAAKEFSADHNEIFERMETYQAGIYLENPNVVPDKYNVPEEQAEQEEFQG